MSGRLWFLPLIVGLTVPIYRFIKQSRRIASDRRILNKSLQLRKYVQNIRRPSNEHLVNIRKFIKDGADIKVLNSYGNDSYILKGKKFYPMEYPCYSIKYLIMLDIDLKKDFEYSVMRATKFHHCFGEFFEYLVNGYKIDLTEEYVIKIIEKQILFILLGRWMNSYVTYFDILIANGFDTTKVCFIKIAVKKKCWQSVFILLEKGFYPLEPETINLDEIDNDVLIKILYMFGCKASQQVIEKYELDKIKWSYRKHHNWPQVIRNRVKTFLMINHLTLNIPNELVDMIIQKHI